MQYNLLGLLALVILNQPVLAFSPNLSQQPNPEIKFFESFIIGQWRGNYQVDNFTMYYGYQFRPNETYSARHRVYQQEKTILDESWEGEWQFDGQILILQGVNKNDPKKKVFIRFQVTKNYQLEYLGGSLPQPYIPLTMGKMGE